jgi:hypothetical protein
MFKALAFATVLIVSCPINDANALVPESLDLGRSFAPSHHADDGIRIAASNAPARRPGPHIEEPLDVHGGELPPSNSRGGRIGQKMVNAFDIAFAAAAVSGVALAVIASAAALFYARRKRGKPDEDAELSDPLQGDSSATSSNPETDIVEVSAFAPAVGQASAEILVQIFFHTLKQAALVDAEAKAIDQTAAMRGRTSLSIEIERGQRIDIVLESASDLKIDEPNQYLVWRGEQRACQFIVTLPAIQEGRKTYHLRARFLLAGVPIGSIRFPLAVSSFEETTSIEMAGTSVQRNRRAFLSYASSDRAEVLKRMQALKVARIDCFQDFLNLEPGERWEKRLYEEIDRCDLFVLFWSSAAAHSQWVAKEAQYALDRRKAQGISSIDITPIILEGPPIPAPPEDLKDIHFNDAIRYVISAVEAETNVSKISQKKNLKQFAKVPVSNRRKSRPSKGNDEMPRWVTSARRIARSMIEGG